MRVCSNNGISGLSKKGGKGDMSAAVVYGGNLDRWFKELFRIHMSPLRDAVHGRGDRLAPGPYPAAVASMRFG